MAFDWYFQRRGREFGPYSGAQLKELAASGRLEPHDMVRRSDRTDAVPAAKVKGLFPEVKPQGSQEVGASALPTPEPSASVKPSPAPPPLPTPDGHPEGIGERLKGLGEVSKAAARLAAAQARKAHLVNGALPAAYLALGRDIHAASRFRDEYPELYAEISEIERQIEQVASARAPAAPPKSLAEHATATAVGVKATAQVKTRSAKKQSVLRRIGESSFAKHKDNSGPEALVRPIEDCLSKMKELDEEILRSTKVGQGGWVTPKRILIGTVGLGIVILMLAARSVKDSTSQSGSEAAGSVVTLRGEVSGPGSTVPDPSGAAVPDFSRVDYGYDFSKDDCQAVPPGAKKQERSKIIEQSDLDEIDAGDPALSGKWTDEQGYINEQGRFVRQGRRVVWFEAERREKYLEEYWFNGKRHGLRITWHRDGSKAGEVGYVNGELHGEIRHWYEGGQMSLRSAFLHGKRHGVRTEWYLNGQKEIEQTFVNDRLQGPFRSWYENGQLKEVAEAVDGKYSGRRTQWFSNGSIRSEFEYDKDGLVYRRGDSIGVFLEKMVALLEFHPKCGGVFPGPMTFDDQSFFEVFGHPDSDVGMSEKKRRWIYRCQDGSLSLEVKHLAPYIWVHGCDIADRSNPVTTRITKSQFKETLQRIAHHYGPFLKFEPEKFFDTFGFPNLELSAGSGNREKWQYIYRCQDGIIVLHVVVIYKQITSFRAVVDRIDLKDIDSL